MSSGDFRLRLIVQALENSSRPQLGEIAGHNWEVVEIIDGEDIPSFTCISYAWGPDTDRQENPFHPGVGPPQISNHTLPSLKSAIDAFKYKTPAFWIDAFCIPAFDPTQPETRKARGATLESMGYIYHTATQVSAVLSSDSYGALGYMLGSIDIRVADRIIIPAKMLPDKIDIDCLENDLWVKSVWTYQEAMGSRYLFFLSENVGSPPIPLEKMVDAVGMFAKDHFNNLKMYPRLDGFLTLGDWLTDDETFALKILVNMDGRETGEPKNYWYARIGALTIERMTRAAGPEEEQLAERFMGTCERLGDFSFIFSVAERESEKYAKKLSRSVRHWRPRPGQLPAAMPEIIWGSAQKGRLMEDGSLELDNIAAYPVGVQGPTPKVIAWFKSMAESIPLLAVADDLASSDWDEQKIITLSIRNLKSCGYTGGTSYILVEDGVFFPQWSIGAYASASVLVSTMIRYNYGLPGLIEVVDDCDKRSYIPGTLVGNIGGKWQNGESTILGVS